VAGSNRIGTDGKAIKYCGDSMIIDPRGKTITSAIPNENCSLTGEISMTGLFEFRKKFPVFNDADDFTIKV
jgi:predicted amidohydrolase